MMRSILTLKKSDVQTEQTEPTIMADLPEEPIEEKPEEQPKKVRKKARKKRVLAPPLVLKLCEQFPKLFNLDIRKPLKVDIEEDILQALAGDASVTTNDLYKALCYYINSTAYLQELGKNDHRFDLKGEVCGLVSDIYSLEANCEKRRNGEVRKSLPPPPLVVKLCERFPNAFNTDNRKPLKVGISKEIIEIMRGEGDGTGIALRQAIQWYTNGIAYHRAVIEQTHRFDLEGNAVEEITSDQKHYATLTIERMKAMSKKRAFVFQNKKEDPIGV